MRRAYLLTGATGFLGKVVLEELLRRREELAVERVIVLIRPRGSLAPAERFAREVAPAPCFARLPRGWPDLVQVIGASLEDSGLGLDSAAAEAISNQVTHLLHAAAAVHFTLPLPEAARANVTTTLNLLELARRCRRLEKMVYVSTAYVTPHPGPGVPIDERLAPLPRPAEEIYREVTEGAPDEAGLLETTGHPNTYTLTKCLAEHLLLAMRGTVPVAIVRPSIISACRRDPFPGWIDSPSGFAAFVMLLGQGQMRVVIGDPRARLDIIPADVVSSRLLAAAHAPAPVDGAGVIAHVVAGLDRSPTVRACWELIRDRFRLQRVTGPWPALWHLGPLGLRARLADLLDRSLTAFAGNGDRRSRRPGNRTRGRVEQLNRVFRYFTERSFAFRSPQPPGDDFEPREYVTLVCRGVSRHLLGQDDREWPVAGRHRHNRNDFLWAFSRPHGNLILRITGWLLSKVLRRTVDQVTIDLPSFEAARQRRPAQATLVLVATHRSYLDFVLCSYLCFARPDLGIPIPYVAAATEFGNIAVLGRLLSLARAFYVARGYKRELRELSERIARMVAAEKTIEFYIEGTRSRTREFLPPKRGLLRCLQETGRTFTLLPVAISFERVPEEPTFLRELTGQPKPRMRFRGFLKWTREAFGGGIQLGRMHLAAGEPIALTPDSNLRRVSQDIMTQLQAATISTTWHLRTYLEHRPVPGGDAEWLRREIEARGGRVLESDFVSPPLDPVIVDTLRHHFAHLFRPDEPRTGPLGHLLDALYGAAGPPAPQPAREPIT